MDQTDDKEEFIPPNRSVIAWFFGALVVWSLLIAFGSIVSANAVDVRKPLIVMGTMGAFLGIWLISLWMRRKHSR